MTLVVAPYGDPAEEPYRGPRGAARWPLHELQPEENRNETISSSTRRRNAGRVERLCGRHLGRRRDLSLPDLFEMGGRLQTEDRRRVELSVDRLGRRHQADQGQDRYLRRFRHAAES